MTDSTGLLSGAAAADVTETQLAQAGEAVVVTEPAVGTTIQIVAPGDSLQLNFDPADVAKAEIKDGNLEITFKDGGVAVVQGYQPWAAAGGQPTGPQGGPVDIAQWGQGGAAAATEPAVCEIPNATVVDVPVPAAGERLSVAVQPGDVIRLNCSFRDVAGAEVGDTLEMTFPGGGVVVVENFTAWVAAQGATVTDCVCGGLNLAEFIVALGLNPEDVIPAAGGEPGGPQGNDLGGSGFTPGPGPQILSGYPYPNILPPTGLNYGVPEPEQSFFPVEEGDDGRPDANDDGHDTDNPSDGGDDDGCVTEGGEGGGGGGEEGGEIEVASTVVFGNLLDNDSGGPDLFGTPPIINVAYQDDGSFPGNVETIAEGDGQFIFIGSFDGVDIWRLTVNAETGDYVFELLAPYPHGEGTSEDQTALENFRYTIQDFDGDTDSAVLSICIEDDEPSVAEPTNVVVEEDNLPGGINENDPPLAAATGSLGVAFGADGPGEVIDAVYTGPALFSQGDAVTKFTYNEATQTLLAETADGRDVFRIVFDASSGLGGEYTFTLLDQLDHPIIDGTPAGDEESLLLDFNVTATDGDGDSIDSDFTVTVLDDVPAPGDGTVQATVEEDDLDGSQSVGNDEDGSGNKDVATGTLAGLVDSGADEPASFALSTDITGLKNQGLKSQGADLSYVVVGDTLTGFVDTNGDGKYVAADDREVFTLKVEADGDYTFTLLDQLDHVDNGLNDENDLTINFSAAVVATDFDKDPIKLVPEAFEITVVDDIPVETGDQVSGTVEEDDLNNGQSKGNNEDISVGKNVAAGSLIPLVSVGTDEPATFGFAGDLSGLAAQGLKSQGSALSYEVVGDTLTGFVDDGDGVLDGGDRQVFTLKVEADGDYTFTLIDQLDHADTGANDENNLAIDFTSTIKATDFDGDEITLDGEGGSTFTITVQDDNPVIVADKTVSATVEEDDLNNAQGLGNNEDGSAGKNVATGAGGALNVLVSPGTDEPVTFGLTTIATDKGVDSGVNSQGKDVLVVSDGTTLTGFVDTNGDGKYVAADDREVFTLTVGGDGSFKFTLIDQVDHVDNGLNDENLLGTAIDLSAFVTATDFDGDEIGLGAGSFTIQVQDDVPLASGEAINAVVEEDDLDNAQSVGNDEDGSIDNEVATGSLSPLVSAGADEPVTFGFGKDLSSLTAQTLTSKGEALSYEVVGDTLTGFVDDGDGKLDAGERQVFTLKVESDGDYAFTLIDQLDHEDDGANDENTLDIDFSAVITATDFDGDEVPLSDGGAGGSQFIVTVEDDIPEPSGKNEQAFVEEDDLDGPQSIGNDEDGSGTKNMATGTLTGVVDVGADEPAVFQLGTDVSGLTAQGLKSQGASLSYAVNGDTLTGFVDDGDGKLDAGDRQVFTLKVESDGDYTFTLLDQVDHFDNGLNDENDLTINLSSVIVATDKDGDEIPLGAEAFEVTVEDDIPVQNQATVIGVVEEEALPGGNQELDDATPDTAVATGNVSSLVNVGADEPATFGVTVSAPVDSGLDAGGKNVLITSDGSKVTGFADLDGDGKFDAGETEIFTLTVESDGDYKFTLTNNIDHPLAGEDTLPFDLSGFVAATDNDGDTIILDKGSFKIDVVDDAPAAIDDTADAAANVVNIVIIFDRSGSMDEDPNVPGFTTRIDLARAAVASMLAAYESVANINIMIVDFAAGAANSGWLGSAVEANAYLAGLDADGTTNYNAAIQETMANYDNGLPPADQTFVYFVSDGKPNPASTSLEASGTVDDWENFLTDEEIDEAFAVGIGQGVDDNDGDLSDIAFPNDDPDNVVIVTDESQVFDALVATVNVKASGNVLTDGTDDLFGADGPGSPQIVSIVVNAQGVGLTTFTFDGTQITNNQALPAIAGATLVVITSLGGELTFDFGDGDYSYETGVDATGQEQFTYTIVDADGDTDSAVLTINLDELQVEQPDRVFGTDGNDTGAGALVGGTGFDVMGGGDGNDSIDADGGDDHISGGSGADTIQGGTGNDVIVGGNQGEVTDSPGVVRAGGADLGDLIQGGEGNDIVFGNEGNDTLRGGAGNDTLNGGSGIDLVDWSDATGAITHTLAGADPGTATIAGLGTDTYTGMQGIIGSTFGDALTGNAFDNILQGGGGNDTLNGGGGKDTFRYTSTVDGQDVIQAFSGTGAGQDILDLDALFDSLNVATNLRDDRTNIVDKGATVDVQVDADNNGSFELTVATLNTSDAITGGSDVVFGTL